MPSVNGQFNLLALSLIGLSGAGREKEKGKVVEGKEPGWITALVQSQGTGLDKGAFVAPEPRVQEMHLVPLSSW